MDFRAQLTEIMNMEQLDALFISALSGEMTEIIKQGREVGIPDTVPFIVPDLTEAEAAGATAEGAIAFAGWSSLTDTPANQAFVQSYMTKYGFGFSPEPWAAQAYATLYILANAIMKAESTDSSKIRDALAKT